MATGRRIKSHGDALHLEGARRQVARFLVEGKRLRIDGGNIHFRGNLIRCEKCGGLFALPFADKATACPERGSTNLTDLAGGFGHGHCCHRHHGRRRR